jgi:hypothetical protein
LKFTDVSEAHTSSIIMFEEKGKETASKERPARFFLSFASEN